MKPKFPTLLIVATFALLASGSVIAQETVRLTFDWPEVVKAKVMVETTIVTEQDNATHRVSGITTYRLEASSTTEGLLITEAEHRINSRTYDGQTMDEPMEWLPYAKEFAGLSLKTFTGQYTVSGSGAFIGIHDFEGTYCRYAALRRGIIKDDVKAKELEVKCRKKLLEKNDPFVDYIRLTETNGASADWTRIVGWWSGSEMVEREIYKFESISPEGATPERGVSTTDTSKYVGRFPCSPTELDSNCVRLEWVSLMDTGTEPRPILDIITSFNPTLLPGGETTTKPTNPSLGSIRRRAETHLLTDPTTLLPRWVEEIDEFRMSTEVGTDNSYAMSRRVHTIWTYEYEMPE